mgnify:CR=1 FL=1
MLPQIGEMRPWADPTITQINRLPMHTPIKRDEKISKILKKSNIEILKYKDQVLFEEKEIIALARTSFIKKNNKKCKFCLPSEYRFKRVYVKIWIKRQL